MAAEGSRPGGSVDSYIGSLISLTSKSEIRYEGVLFNINTEESSIGLRNVRSFGTEGRKKDGPQVPPSDRVYEYILFRGSDIKDLQVKSSPPVQSAPTMHNDPAIIQSHYPHQASVSTSSLSAGSGSVGDLSSYTAQMGLPRSTFQGGLPLYQPGGNLGSWGSSPAPPSANGSGLPMPMYWHGPYGPSIGLPHVQQLSLLRPPPGLSMPSSLQQTVQDPGMNPSLPTEASNLPASSMPGFPPHLIPPVSSGSLNFTSAILPPSSLSSSLPSVQSAALASETLPAPILNKAPSPALPTATLSSTLPLVSPLSTSSLDISSIVPPTNKPKIIPSTNKPKTVSGPIMPYQTMSQAVSSISGTSSSSHAEASTPSLVTPGQLLQPGPRPTTLASSQSSLTAQKDIEVVPVSSSSSEPLPPTTTNAQTPILPLPSSSYQKLNGAPLHTRQNNRGRERGRGNWISRPVTKFTEDFDFLAMNEKFNKDEVWGHLGKSNKAQSRDNGDDEDYSQDEDVAGSSEIEIKPVYVKDDFFDSLSCNSLDGGSRNGRTKFSEQMKLDTETFGDFPRNRGSRGGRGPGRGGRSRGYYGRGYGYVGRGRGHNVSSRAN